MSKGLKGANLPPWPKCARQQSLECLKEDEKTHGTA